MPILEPLVSSQDFTDYGYDPAAVDKANAASARVRRFTGQQITPGTSTHTMAGSGPWLLPQRPVVEVTSVTDQYGADVSWTLEGQWLTTPHCGPVTVTYDHGRDPLPDELVELVCAIASRLHGMSDAMAAGVRSEAAGGESITWGADAWSGTTGLTRPEMEALRRLFPRYPRTTILRATP